MANAVDVAKEAADLVLLKQDLNVLLEGILQGRRTFANTLKYVFMATSANFGNMFSVVGASAFLPFLPMLPIQVLVNNLLYDFSTGQGRFNEIRVFAEPWYGRALYALPKV